MGGTPWKSEGCNTCRRRRVKCDVTKPSCKRCEKGGFQCEGYTRERRFIHTSSKKPQSHWRSVWQPPADVDEVSKSAVAIQKKWNAPVSPSSPDMTPEVRSQFLSFFVDVFLPAPSDGLDRGNIIDLLPSMLGQSPVLDNAITALCSLFIGKTYKDDALKQDALSLYTITLQGLLRSIQKVAVPPDDTLYATVVLGYYELINQVAGETYGWISHSVGASMLLHRRGRPSAENRMATRLYQRLELLTFYTAAGQRRSAFLTDPEWREKPNEVYDNRDYFDTLMELLNDCTTMLDYIDRITQHRGGQELFSVIERMLCFGLILEDRLIKWHDNEFPTAPEWEPQKTDNALMRLLEPLEKMDLAFNITEPFQFKTFKVGQAHILYWTGMVLLYPVLSKLVQLYETTSPSNTPRSDTSSPPPDGVEDLIATRLNSRTADDFTELADHAAVQICRNSPFFLQPKFKAIGLQSVMSPLWGAQQFFRSHERYNDKDKWCIAVFGIVYTKGIGFASRLAHLPWSKYPRAQRIVGL